MKTSDKKRSVRCSHCERQGHTKRSCPEGARAQKKAPAKKSVAVRVDHKKESSAHVVNLKKKEDRLKHIKAFREAMAPKTKRIEVDIASLITRSNKEKEHRARVDAAKGKPALPVEALPEDLAQSVVAVRAQAVQKKKERKKKKIGIPKLRIGERCTDLAQSVHQTVTHFFSGSSVSLAARVLVLLLIIAVPFPTVSYVEDVQDASSRIVEASTAGFLSLQSSTVAALSSNIDQAEMDLSYALTAFSEAQEIVDKEHAALQSVAKIIPVLGTQITSRQHMLEAGHHLALGNTYLVKGIDAAKSGEDLKTTDRFVLLTRHIRSAIPQYEQALEAMGHVHPSALPNEYQQPFEEFRLLFAAFIDDLEDFTHLGDALHDVFGGEGFRRYLVVFQNNREIRATGGFLGSAAIIDVQKGEILNIEVPGGGLYDWQGQLTEHVEPPLPLQLVNARWHAHDANYWPDFEASAKKIQWFYENSRGATVDGVIAVNADVFTEVLQVLGPIESEEFGLVFEADDALDVLQKQVEVDYDKEENKPKEVIGSLTAELLEQEYETLDVVRLLSVWHRALQTKDIQIQVNDTEQQELFRSFGWTGDVAAVEQEQDYLMVVNTNVQGQKSDAKINQHIDHQVIVREDGTALATVVVERTHTGEAGEQFFGAANINYLRVYVPKGATLLEASGFQYPPEEAFKVPATWAEKDADAALHEKEERIHPNSGTQVMESFDKTVFGNWMITSPGETSKAYFTYELPFLVISEQAPAVTLSEKLVERFAVPASTYSLLVQKQSGVNSTFDTKVIYPEGWSPVWVSDSDIDLALNGTTYSSELKTDITLGSAFESRTTSF